MFSQNWRWSSMASDSAGAIRSAIESGAPSASHRELRENHLMRESLAGTARSDRASFEGEALAGWLEQPCIPISLWMEITTILLALFNLAAIFLALAGKLSAEVPLSTLVLVGILTTFLHQKLQLGRAIKSADPVVIYELELLASYRRALQSERFHGELLNEDMRALQSLSVREIRRILLRVKLMRWHEDQLSRVSHICHSGGYCGRWQSRSDISTVADPSKTPLRR